MEGQFNQVGGSRKSDSFLENLFINLGLKENLGRAKPLLLLLPPCCQSVLHGGLRVHDREQVPKVQRAVPAPNQNPIKAKTLRLDCAGQLRFAVNGEVSNHLLSF